MKRSRIGSDFINKGYAAGHHTLTRRSLGTTPRTISVRPLRRIHHPSSPRQASAIWPQSLVPVTELHIPCRSNCPVFKKRKRSRLRSINTRRRNAPPVRGSGTSTRIPTRRGRSSRCAGPHRRARPVVPARSRRGSSVRGIACDRSRPWWSDRCPSSRRSGRRTRDAQCCARGENTGPASSVSRQYRG